MHVTAAGNTEFCNNVQCRRTEHLIFLIPKRLRRRNHDTVTGMDAYRVDVFHIADSNAIACGIAHYLILNLFPAGDTPLNQTLPHAAQPQSVGTDIP